MRKYHNAQNQIIFRGKTVGCYLMMKIKLRSSQQRHFSSFNLYSSLWDNLMILLENCAISLSWPILNLKLSRSRFKCMWKEVLCVSTQRTARSPGKHYEGDCTAARQSPADTVGRTRVKLVREIFRGSYRLWKIGPDFRQSVEVLLDADSHPWSAHWRCTNYGEWNFRVEGIAEQRSWARYGDFDSVLPRPLLHVSNLDPNAHQSAQ